MSSRYGPAAFTAGRTSSRCFLHDGAVVAVSRESMLRGRADPSDPHAFFGTDRRGFEVEPGETVEIDCRRDLLLAEAVLRERRGEVRCESESVPAGDTSVGRRRADPQKGVVMPGTSMNIAPSPVRPEALTPLKIDARLIGPGRPTFVVAEIGVNHDGSVNRALELVRIASNCGADAVKLQIFRATTLVHPSCRLAEYQRQQLPSDDPIDMLKRYELSSEDIARVVKAIRDLKLIPLATPFSPDGSGAGRAAAPAGDEDRVAGRDQPAAVGGVREARPAAAGLDRGGHDGGSGDDLRLAARLGGGVRAAALHQQLSDAAAGCQPLLDRGARPAVRRADRLFGPHDRPDDRRRWPPGRGRASSRST